MLSELAEQFKAAAERSLPEMLRGQIEYIEQDDRLILKSKALAIFEAFRPFFDFNPEKKDGFYISTHEIVVSEDVEPYLAEFKKNLNKMPSNALKNYFESAKSRLVSYWEAYAKKYLEEAIIFEIYKKAKAISTFEELDLFNSALIKFQSRKSDVNAAAEELRKIFQKKRDYYTAEFHLTLEDLSSRYDALSLDGSDDFQILVKYVIEPAILRSSIKEAGIKIRKLISENITPQSKDYKIFVYISGLIELDELSIDTLNHYLRSAESIYKTSAPLLFEIYRQLGVFDLNFKNFSRLSLPEPKSYERFLSDGRRITKAAFRAANAASMFNPPEELAKNSATLFSEAPEVQSVPAPADQKSPAAPSKSNT